MSNTATSFKTIKSIAIKEAQNHELIRSKERQSELDGYVSCGNVMLKRCGRCKRDRELICFGKHSNSKDGLQIWCKDCKKKYCLDNVENEKNRRKKYYQKNKNKINKKNKEYYKNNKEKISEYYKQYVKENKEKIKEYKKQYYTEHENKIKEYKKEYYEKHKEDILKCNKLYRTNNKEKVSEINKKWQRDHIECTKKIKRKGSRKRRAKKAEVEELFDSDMEAFVLDVFDNKCFNCGSINNLHIDHFRPLSRGFKLEISNALVLCISCNSAKHNKMPEKYFGTNKSKIIQKILNENNLKWIKRKK